MEDRFINPYTDYGFKKLFGTEQNADLLTSFLNALIDDGEQPCDPIVSVTYKNVEHIGEINTMRSSYFDVFCQTQSGATADRKTAPFVVSASNVVYKKMKSVLKIKEVSKKHLSL